MLTVECSLLGSIRTDQSPNTWAADQRRAAHSSATRAYRRLQGLLAMQELLLLATVPPSRHDQLLKIMAGVAGMAPSRVVERHVIWRPDRIPSSKEAPIGASQGVQDQQIQAFQGQLKGDLFYLQLVGDVTEMVLDRERRDLKSSNRHNGTALPSIGDSAFEDVHTNNRPSVLWSLCFSDLPEVAGRRPATSRMISRVDILQGHISSFMVELGYECVRPCR